MYANEVETKEKQQLPKITNWPHIPRELALFLEILENAATSCANVFVRQRMDYRPVSQGTQRQFTGVLKQWPLVLGFLG